MNTLLSKVCIAFLLQTISAVLTGYEIHSNDITNNRNFGCTWSSVALNCKCREDAEEMFITENSIPAYDAVPNIIIECKKVRFGSKSLIGMRNLREIKLLNIETLHFEESSLIWYGYRDVSQYRDHYEPEEPSLKISIENSNITQISSHTFEGRINSIYFNNVQIGIIAPFSFNALSQTQHILLRNTKIKEISFQAFKKFSTETFVFDSVEIETIPSRFVDVKVYERFTLKNCTFATVHPSGFIITMANARTLSSVEILDTKISHLNGEAFHISTGGNVIFRNNVFDVIDDGAFRGIQLNRNLETNSLVTPLITFDSNVFTTLTRASLTINNDQFQVKYNKLRLNQGCDCYRFENYLNNLKQFYGNIECIYNNDFVTIEDFKHHQCSLLQSHTTIFIIVGVVCVLCFIITTLLFVYYKHVYRCRTYGSAEKQTENGKNLSLIVPDGKTYRETELHVIIERADLLTTDL